MERKQCWQNDHITTQRVFGGFWQEIAVGFGNTEGVWGVLAGNSSWIFEATNQGACSIYCGRIGSQIIWL